MENASIKAAEQSVHLTGGILRHFQALSTPKQNPALEVLSTPAHPQVTQTVRHQNDTMNTFDEREVILSLQESMLTGTVEKVDYFLALINFENWCCNSGVSGFVQDYKEDDLEYIQKFITEFGFSAIENVVAVIRKYIKKYGVNFIDSLSETEYDDLSQYDDEFFEIHDQFTSAIYKKFISNK
jgi:hypothetical protein